MVMSLIYLFTNIFIHFCPGRRKFLKCYFLTFWNDILYETYSCHHRCINLASFRLYTNKLFLNKNTENVVFVFFIYVSGDNDEPCFINCILIFNRNFIVNSNYFVGYC